MIKRRKCPHCAAMQKQLDTVTFHYNYVIANLPQIFKDKQAVLDMVPRLLQWGKNAEHDRTAVAKAGQELELLMRDYKAATKKQK